MRFAAVAVVLLSVSGVALGEPLTPIIISHDFNFGAYNAAGPAEYLTNGTQADTLTYALNPAADREVTAYWPNWPTPPVYPVWDLGGQSFGGDFVLAVQFTGQDAPYAGPGGTLDVSLTGTGLNTRPGAADLEIYGTIQFAAAPVSGLLWAIDLSKVSLYGYSGRSTYVLEGVGTIVGGILAVQDNLIGTPGAMRGNLDFVDAPGGWMPSLYNPLGATGTTGVRAAYSGETGATVPEPATMLLLAAGLCALKARRK